MCEICSELAIKTLKRLEVYLEYVLPIVHSIATIKDNVTCAGNAQFILKAKSGR